MPSSDIRTRVDAFVTELEGMIRNAIREGFEAALGGHAGSPRPRRGRPPGSKNGASAGGAPAAGLRRSSRKKGQKRSPAELAAIEGALYSYIKQNPGKRIEEINKVLKLPTKELARPVQKLMAQKKIKRQGQKRASKYFPAG